VTIAVGQSRLPVRHAGHGMRAGMVPLEETERGAPDDRLQQESSQRREGEAASAQGLDH
jgi:hypothetical protein